MSSLTNLAYTCIYWYIGTIADVFELCLYGFAYAKLLLVYFYSIFVALLILCNRYTALTSMINVGSRVLNSIELDVTKIESICHYATFEADSPIRIFF